MITSTSHRTRARLAATAEAPAPRTQHRLAGTVGIAALGVGVAAVSTGPRVAVALVAAAIAVLAYRHWRGRSEAGRRRAAQLPPALEALATSVRTGASLPTALREVGTALEAPLGPELEALARAAAHGRPIAAVLDEWSAHHDDPGTRLAATALVLATVVGSTPARALDGVASTLRERLDLAAERRALSTQARTSALVLALAPAAFGTVLVLGDTPAAGFLLGSPAGWACLVIGVAFDATGAWWMSRLTRGPQP
jgi:tight adherence protein B